MLSIITKCFISATYISIVIYFHNLFTVATGKTPHQFLTEYRIENAKKMLWNTECILSDIATNCGYSSQQHFSTIFKKETGHTLTEYVTSKRIDHAVFLLNSTKMQIQTIAQHCGVVDVQYFSKIFKKYTGMTPSEYAKNLDL